jgi:2-methylcitrate dehydratase PrpD
MTMDRRRFLQTLTVASAGAAASAQAQTESGTGSKNSGPKNSGSKSPGEAKGQTRRLADYASSLRYEDIPADVIQRAKDSIADTVAVIMFGGDLPWSRMIAAYAKANGGGGRSRILGAGAPLVHAPSAALANGAFAHAFEMDNLTKPNSGSHPGATMLSSALAVAQERGGGGRELLTAFVAGAEVMIRIGVATKHSNEEHGFHAPGTTGPFGAAVASSRMLALDAEKTGNAIGIAASLAAGILEFAKSGTGAMVKRLHLGRAAESGVLAASLAAEGFTGPVSALEGEFGFLRVFCRDFDMDALTRGLGETWATRSIMMKRYAAHITAHTPVDSTLALRAAHGFGGEDVASIGIAGTERMLRVNNIPAPKDMMMAQYSIPFCVALSLYRNPVDPRSFDEAVARDPKILDLASRVKMTLAAPHDDRADLATTVTIALKDGRAFTQRATDFMGTPERPLGRAELREKFLLTTQKFGGPQMARAFERLQNLESEKTLDWIGA